MTSVRGPSRASAAAVPSAHCGLWPQTGRARFHAHGDWRRAPSRGAKPRAGSPRSDGARPRAERQGHADGEVGDGQKRKNEGAQAAQTELTPGMHGWQAASAPDSRGLARGRPGSVSWRHRGVGTTEVRDSEVRRQVRCPGPVSAAAGGGPSGESRVRRGAGARRGENKAGGGRGGSGTWGAGHRPSSGSWPWQTGVGHWRRSLESECESE